MNKLTIGKVAKQSGLGIETVRFYERQGLIEPPPRSESGYRQYPEETISKLDFIRRAKELGFSLKEIQELLALKYDPKATKADVKRRTQHKIDAVKNKINDLTRIQKALEHLINACDGHGPVSDCPIINALEDD